MTDESEKKAIEAGAPARPEKRPQADSAEASGDSGAGTDRDFDGLGSESGDATYSSKPSSSQALRVSAGFGSRLVAYILDLIIVSVLSWPLLFAFSAFWSLFPFPFFGEWDFVDFVARTATTFLYFGWFYKEKGASPGKMLLGIEVINLDGRRLGYGQTFAREIIGKFISAVPLLIGYLIAAFRADGRALHDLLFDTRVVAQPVESDIVSN